MRASTIELIKEIEGQFNVEKWSIDGTPIWPFLRMKIGHRLEIERYSGKSAHQSARRSPVSRATRALFCTIDLRTILENCEVLILNDGSGYYRAMGGEKNRHFDFIVNAHELASSGGARFLDYADSGPSASKLREASIECWLDRQYLKSMLLHFVLPKRPNIDFGMQYKSFLEHCKGIGVYDVGFEIAAMALFIKRWNYVCRKIESVLAKLADLKVCYITTYYGFYGLAFTAALKKSGVKVVDVQHGLQGKSHYAYASWKLNQGRGYAQIPEYFIVWTDCDKNSLAEWIREDNVFVIGIPFEDIGEEVEADGVKNSGCTEILYSCSNFPVEREIGLLQGIASIGLRNVHFLVRSHPTDLDKLDEIDAYLKEISLQNYELFESSRGSLASVIKAADMHVTICSSVAIEFNSSGKKSLLPKEYAYSVLDEYNIGLFEYFATSSELKGLIGKVVAETKGGATRQVSVQQTFENAKCIVRKLLE